MQAGRKFFDWLGQAKMCLDLGVKAFIENDCPNALVFLDPRRILVRTAAAVLSHTQRLTSAAQLSLPNGACRQSLTITWLPSVRPQEIFLKVGPIEILGQHDMNMKNYFKSPKLRALFTMQACPRPTPPEHAH